MTLRPTTLRARLFLGTSLATALILLAAGLLLYFTVRASMFAEFDMALRSSADALAALTEQTSAGVRMEPEVNALIDFTRKRKAPDFFSTSIDTGQIITASDSLEGRPFPHPTPPIGVAVTNAVTLPDGLPGRQTTLTFVPMIEDPPGHLTPGNHVATVTVGRHTKDLDRKLLRLIGILLAVGAVATLGAAGAMLLAVRQGLRPLGALAGRIAQIGNDNLDQRIEVADAPPELSIVVHRLNELLDRLQATIGRERRFTADVAHELRTPLAGISVLLDVCATRPRLPHEYQETVDKCQHILRGMQGMVECLLTIARADAGQLPVTISAVPIPSLLHDCWTVFESAAEEKNLRVTFDLNPDLVVHTDPEKLRMVINNLFDNAVHHANTGGWIRIEAHPGDGSAIELRIANSGSTLTDAQARRAFDRFWQGDAARRHTGLHCGLGLSLCCELMSLLAGHISVTSDRNGTFTALIRLPVDWSASSAPLPSASRPALTPQVV